MAIYQLDCSQILRTESETLLCGEIYLPRNETIWVDLQQYINTYKQVVTHHK